jgi:hypothetical protein
MKPLYGKLLLQGSNKIIGTGWLHYDCILNNLVLDFWSLLGASNEAIPACQVHTF